MYSRHPQGRIRGGGGGGVLGVPGNTLNFANELLETKCIYVYMYEQFSFG